MLSLKRIAKSLISPWVRTRGPRGCIYLTFDDGPDSTHTRAVLSALRRHDAKATFFMIGEQMNRHPDIVAEVVAQGHAVGFHAYRHRHLAGQTMTDVLEDLRALSGVAQRLGLAFSLYRPPYGEMSLLRLLWCIAHGVRTMMWSLESRDSFTDSTDELTEQLSPQRVRDGDIILLHDDTAVTVAALPSILERLRSGGFQFGVLSK